MSRDLPARPSLDSLRKQAKKLMRDAAAGDAGAIARVRAHLPNSEAPPTQRDAQLAIAREYGFAGWQDLTAAVRKRLGEGFDWAIGQARRAIHDNDVERLKQLLAEHPALLTWQDPEKQLSLLEFATAAYGDAGDPQREEWFTRGACAELLIDAGAVVTPRVCEGIVMSRARGLLQLFSRKGLLPRTPKFFAALGDLDAVRAALDGNAKGLAAVEEAFAAACAFAHPAVAALLLERAIALDPELGRHVDADLGRAKLVDYFIANGGLEHDRETALGLWRSFVMSRIERAAHESDVAAFADGLRREPWLLGDDFVRFQARLIEIGVLNDREANIAALLDSSPAILRRQPPPPSQAIEFAFTYAHTHLVPLLARIWPVPDDLPHAAGMGDLARVQQWFDASGALRSADGHYPYNDPRARSHLGWDTPTAQQVLDVALAFAVANGHFAVADFLLERGADIDTRWGSHEPASLLHHLISHGTYESMQFVIDRGIDMTIKDYRWNATAQGWAYYANNDHAMAAWLEDAERRQNRRQT